MKLIKHRAVVQMVVDNTVPKWKRWLGFIAWRLRPEFLKKGGRPIRLRWWICWHLMRRLDPLIRSNLGEGRALMFNHHAAGRSSSEWMRGKRMAMRARLLEARMLWLAYEGGAQFPEGDSDIELLHFAGMDIVRDPRKAR